jgi:quinol monooxygenase YgiN
MKDLFSRRSFCAAGVGLATLGFNRMAQAADGDTDETITQIAKFKLNMDKEEEGLKVLQELCAAVEANEPDVLAYICSRSAKNPDELVFFEVYKNEEALQAHGKAPHMGQVRKAFGTLLLPPLEITRLDRIGGFAR